MSSYRISPKGTLFIKTHEGTVTRAYKDQGGVVTIGVGFTNLSPVCAGWFKAKWGRPLRMGDKMTEAECEQLLAQVLNHEVAPVANKLLPDCQERFDAESSVIYNCGPGAAKWKWAQAAMQQLYATAASRLRTTAITAMGIPSNGLRKRRQAEAALLEDRTYNIVSTSHATDSDDLRVVQKGLTTLGYYKGTIDGVMGPLTMGAVKNFQRAYGLKVDGIVGNATKSTLARALDARKGQNIALGGGGGTGGVSWLAGDWLQLDNPLTVVGIVIAAVAVLYVGYLIWSHRGAILGRRTLPSA